MKAVASFSTLAEAHLALTRLESAGVEAVIRDEFMVTADWLCSNATGGVKIEVVEDDFAAARAILALPAPEAGVLQCPHCGSHDLHVRVLSVLGVICVLLKLPLRCRGRRWTAGNARRLTRSRSMGGERERARCPGWRFGRT